MVAGGDGTKEHLPPHLPSRDVPDRALRLFVCVAHNFDLALILLTSQIVPLWIVKYPKISVYRYQQQCQSLIWNAMYAFQNVLLRLPGCFQLVSWRDLESTGQRRGLLPSVLLYPCSSSTPRSQTRLNATAPGTQQRLRVAKPGKQKRELIKHPEVSQCLALSHSGFVSPHLVATLVDISSSVVVDSKHGDQSIGAAVCLEKREHFKQ